MVGKGKKEEGKGCRDNRKKARVLKRILRVKITKIGKMKLSQKSQKLPLNQKESDLQKEKPNQQRKPSLSSPALKKSKISKEEEEKELRLISLERRVARLLLPGRRCRKRFRL